MRKFTIVFGLSGAALAASLAWAADDKKKDEGPGMTFNQKVGSVFGLVDTGSYNAPPTPPGMPRMGSVNAAPVPGGTRDTGSTNNAMNNAPRPKPQARSGTGSYDPSLPQPPQPLRMAEDGSGNSRPATTGGAAATNRNAAATAPSGAPRQSIVVASQNVGGGGGNAATRMNGTGAAGSSNNQNVGGSSSASSGNGSIFGGTSINSSRRKPTTGSTPSASTPTATNPTTPSTAGSAPAELDLSSIPMAETTPIATPTPKQAADQFTPDVPQFQAPSEAKPASEVASSNRPAVLPPSPQTVVEPTLPSTSANAAAPQTTSPNSSTESTSSTASSEASGRSNVLAAHTSPEVSVETIGPRQIAIGREASYRVVVRNRGSSEVQNVVVQLGVPGTAEIVGLSATSGNCTSADESSRGAPIEWHLAGIGARSNEELVVAIIPRRSESLELNVRCTTASPTARAVVEVQEPKLELAVNGPSEVSYGQQRVYKLTVSNPGTGTAENVVLHLMPLSANDGEPISHTIGDLKAGQTNVVEVELTARQAGQLQIRSSATAAGGLRADGSASVAVRRAALDVTTAAPRLLFAGIPGTYEVRVRNTGDDTARQVRVAVDLPAGAKLLGTAPAAVEDQTGQLVWNFEHLAAGAEQVCTIKCSWNHIGKQELSVQASAEGDVRKTTIAATEVQAVADLALDVIDTPGPIAVGQPVTYEIHAKNRGLKGAEGVEVVAYFSDGIEPEKADGQAYDLQPGMVVFKPFAVVSAGQEKVLKVVARALKPGQHRLRVELRSTSPETQLSHEDATFFYSDEAPGTVSPAAASPIQPTSGTLPKSPAPRGNNLR